MYVDRDYFSIGEMGCYTGKFANKGENSSNYYNLKCDSKDEIAYMWDGEFSKQIEDQTSKFGCMNTECKSVFE
jgi:hypothetical protein